MLDDKELILRCLRGEEDGYVSLLNKYKSKVFSLVYRIVRQREDAEEIVSDAFVRVFRNLQKYNPEFPFSNWLFKIATNLSIDFLRRRKPDSISLDDEENVIEIESMTTSPLEMFSTMSELEKVEHAISCLKPEYRIALLLRHKEEKTYEEIAEILSMPIGTVKIRIHRAKKELIRKLKAMEKITKI